MKRKRSATNHSAPLVDSTANKAREDILQEVQSYVSSLAPAEAEELHQVVESEIRKTRPNIVEIHRDTRIYQSFLETIVAAKLGRELPETN